MSWYSEYKPNVDAFISACLYLAFFWNLFKNIPSILQGVATGGNIILGLFEYDPAAMAVDNEYKEREKELHRLSIDERYDMHVHGYTEKANALKRYNIDSDYSMLQKGYKDKANTLYRDNINRGYKAYETRQRKGDK